jgi:hypothetical protein
MDDLIAALDVWKSGEPHAALLPLAADARGRLARAQAHEHNRTLALVMSVAAALGLIVLMMELNRRGLMTTEPKPAPITVDAAPTTARRDVIREPSPSDRPLGPGDRSSLPTIAEASPKPAKSITVPARALAPPIPTAVDTAEPVGVVRELKGHAGRVNGVAVSSNGKLALSGGQDRTVRLWDVSTGTELRRAEHDGPVEAVAISADGRSGLSGARDTTVRLWDFRGDHPVGMRRLDGHTGAVFAVAYASDDHLALSAGADRTIRVWNIAAGRADGPPLVHDSAVVAIATSQSNDAVAG